MPALSPGRVRHTVSFVLAHPEGSAEETDFLAAAARLADVVPGVEAFEVLREVSPKNGFDHGLSMEFADRAAYEAYNEHPEHVAFVADRWDAEVTDFLELDYEAR
jgi:heme-degrading monooxygenase HmoA